VSTLPGGKMPIRLKKYMIATITSSQEYVYAEIMNDGKMVEFPLLPMIVWDVSIAQVE
jgi:hypothetical protein